MFTSVFGRRGSGKTTLIRALIPNLKKPVVVIDVLGNFQGYDFQGVPAYETDSIQAALLALKAYLEKPDENSPVIVVESADLATTIDFVCSALWRVRGGTLVLDEADAFSLADSPCFDEAIRYGRNRGIDVVTGCRRPAEVSKQITAAADTVYALATHEPRDIEYYRDFLGDTLAFQIPKLPQYHGVYRDFQTQQEGIFKTDANGKICIVKNIVKTI